FSRSPWYSLPDHLSRFRVRAARTSRRGFSRQHRITQSRHAAVLRRPSGLMSCGFAYSSPCGLARGQPSPRWATYLPHPYEYAYLLPNRVLRSTTTSPKGSRWLRALSITGRGTGGFSRLREYRPVVRRIRLAALP